jgi:hypothetical protein
VPRDHDFEILVGVSERGGEGVDVRSRFSLNIHKKDIERNQAVPRTASSGVGIYTSPNFL